mmetsp:Transcript_30114/g.70849  ORF Transcript_30114/g.70849 Transcript_30114/m.70849 type:complete len:300 (+) Transcript_30114:53-952(+)
MSDATNRSLGVPRCILETTAKCITDQNWELLRGLLVISDANITADMEFDDNGRLANITGCTPLIVSAWFGSREAVLLCCQSGAFPNRLSTRGSTPLSVAGFRGHTDIVTTLLELGADPTIPDQHGRVARDLAAENQHHDAVMALLAAEDSPVVLDAMEARAKAESMATFPLPGSVPPDALLPTNALVVRAGLVRKKGGGKGKERVWSKGGRRNFKMRYVVLWNDAVSWFASENSPQPKGTIPLDNKDWDVQRVENRENRLVVTTRSRDLTLQATTFPEISEWMDAFQEVRARCFQTLYM